MVLCWALVVAWFVYFVVVFVFLLRILDIDWFVCVGLALGFAIDELEIINKKGLKLKAYLKLYAERKKWDLQEVFVYLTYSKKHRVDLDIATDKPTRFDHLQKKLKFIGNLDKK